MSNPMPVLPGLTSGLRAIAMTRTSATDRHVLDSHADQLSIVVNRARLLGLVDADQADALIRLGASPFESGTAQMAEDRKSHFAWFRVGDLGIVMYMGTAAGRDTDGVAHYQQHLAKAIRESGARELIFTEPSRMARTSTDNQNPVYQTMREVGVTQIHFSETSIDLRTESGWDDLAQAYADSARTRNVLVRKLTDRRALQESRERWSRGQNPPAGYRLDGDRRIEVDPDLERFILNVLAPAMDSGLPWSEAGDLLREYRILGPRLSGTRAWRMAAEHELYPEKYRPDARGFCRAVGAWLSGVYACVESCPLEADEYLGQPVTVDEAGRRSVTTHFPVGRLTGATEHHVQMLLALQERLEAANASPPTRRRLTPLAGLHFDFNGVEVRFKSVVHSSGQRRYAVMAPDGMRVATVGRSLEAELTKHLSAAIGSGIGARPVPNAELDALWRRWLRPADVERPVLEDQLAQVDERISFAVEQATAASTSHMRLRYAERAEKMSREAEGYRTRLAELMAVEDDHVWRVESDLVPRALAGLASGAFDDDVHFPQVIQSLLVLRIRPASPGRLRVAASLRAPTSRGVVLLGPVEFDVADLTALRRFEPADERQRRLFHAAGQWLTASDPTALAQSADPWADTGRAARLRVGKTLREFVPPIRVPMLMQHPADEARAAAWRIICGATDTTQAPDSAFEDRIRSTYITGEFGRTGKGAFLLRPSTTAVLRVVLDHGGSAARSVVVDSIACGEHTRGSAETLVSKAKAQRLVVDAPTPGVLAVRLCRCGGQFDFYVAVPEIGDHLLCSRCRRDPTGLMFPASYLTLSGDRDALLDPRRGDLSERRLKRRGGVSEAQMLRRMARHFGYVVGDQGHMPKAIRADTLRRQAVIAELAQLLGQNPETLSEEWCALAAAATALEAFDIRDVEGLVTELEQRTSAAWRETGRRLQVTVPARGPLSKSLRLRVLLAEAGVPDRAEEQHPSAS